MIYLALDTNVWLELMKAKLDTENNVFDEVMYWIDRQEIKCITSVNLIREWDRHKEKQIESLVKEERSRIINVFKINDDLTSSIDNDKLAQSLRTRVQKIDAVLKTHSEIAPESDEIILEAWQRCHQLLAPNHKKDSFRDTMNILCILSYCRKNDYSAFFSTRDEDYYDRDPAVLHPNLVTEFQEAGVEYVYFNNDLSKNTLINKYLRSKLSDYQKFLANKRKRDTETEKQKAFAVEVSNDEYLENIPLLDDILSNPNPNRLQMKIVEMFINSHESYKQHFLKKVGDNGLV